MICTDTYSNFSTRSYSSQDSVKDVNWAASNVSELQKLVDTDENLKEMEGLIRECIALLNAIKDQDVKFLKDEVFEPLNKVEIGFDLIRQRLLTCAYFKLSAQEYTELENESIKPADPSVEFFGLEWSSVFSRCYELLVEIRLLKAGMKKDRFSRKHLSECLALVNQLIAETQMHAAALNSGCLRASHLSLQLEQQQLHAKVGRTNSYQKKLDNRSSENKTKVARVSSNKLKYEKTSLNKTYSNEAKQDQKCKTDSKPVSDEEKQKHQTSSLVRSVSNIFRSLLEL